MQLHHLPTVSAENKKVHSWLHEVTLAFHPAAMTSLLDVMVNGIKEEFNRLGHTILPQAEGSVDVLITTALIDQPVDWRKSMLFTSKRRFNLDKQPTVFTIIQLTRHEFNMLLDRLQVGLNKETPDPSDYDFPGLAPQAYLTLHEQGRRAGPIQSLVRLLQALSMCIRIILVIGEVTPEEAYVFDLVGAYPKVLASDRKVFFQDLVVRILTAVCTSEITDHETVDELIPLEVWKRLSTPSSMRRAGEELGKRHFFTEMVDVASLANIPVFGSAIARQYSEGCFATWEPEINGLITTITGSARPVAKDLLSDDELAVITGIRPDGRGAIVRHVKGKRNDAPSSEAVELFGMDENLPRINLSASWNIYSPVPIARSKLHGHRSIASFDPATVEYVPLDPSYHHYPVSCSTEAQAEAIISAFSRSLALNNSCDERNLVFTISPGHGCIIVEKWVDDKEPFQIIWEAMDSGAIDIASVIPQGEFYYQFNNRKMVIQEKKPVR